eukprot:TRINITY_DN1473_c0_g1_i5.p1 TRINITY_DN1473_c0_g1~~TRINITY_DN1473_c0_g1_i5.p1  ORF type:complete len:571 (+),score=90.71 TRINITY_DN1473_c0_g1_i5:28-1740(+)
MRESWPLAVILLFAFASSVSGECLQQLDNATVPNCHNWINPDNEPFFFPHQYNCSRYWECNVYISPNYEACLRECPPAQEGLEHWENTLRTCTYPFPPWSNCTFNDPECGKCEAWQECEILNNGTIICTPDCKLDVHCDGNEYCDWEEGGEGHCYIGCRNNEPCGTKPCDECIDHKCDIKECCVDADCPENNKCVNGKCQFECVEDDDCADNEWCDAGKCRIGCRNDGQCQGTDCSTCENHQCHDPECCADKDCLNSEYCDENNECKPGCNEDSDCISNGECATCDLNAHQCSEPECCIDDECKDCAVCMADFTCTHPECCTNDDCSDPEPVCDTDNNVCIECLVDADCEHGEVCDNNTCIEGCRKDKDCDMWDGICNGDYSEDSASCFYCDKDNAEIGQCTPGCITNQNCYEDAPNCNGDHHCVAQGGGNLLRNITILTESCSGCSTNDEGGPVLYFQGGQGTSGIPDCTTNALDHSNQVDFGTDPALFQGEPDKDLLGGCYLSNLQGKVEAGTIKWTGSGTYNLKQIDIGFIDVESCYSTCCLSGPIGSTPMEMECKYNCDNETCPFS